VEQFLEFQLFKTGGLFSCFYRLIPPSPRLHAAHVGSEVGQTTFNQSRTYPIPETPIVKGRPHHSRHLSGSRFPWLIFRPGEVQDRPENWSFFPPTEFPIPRTTHGIQTHSGRIRSPPPPILSSHHHNIPTRCSKASPRDLGSYLFSRRGTPTLMLMSREM
jgi:hypothetical protein